MAPLNRREFLNGVVATGTALAASSLSVAEASQSAAAPVASRHTSSGAQAGSAAIDFRYAPLLYQTAFCFPDDPHKSLVSQSGQLLYGFDNSASLSYFPLKIGFGLNGMPNAKVLGQELESPAIPIVRTTIDDHGVAMVLTTFATNDDGEGRIDNVLVEVVPHSSETVNIEPHIEIESVEKFDLVEKDGVFTLLGRNSHDVLLVGKAIGSPSQDNAHGGTLSGETAFVQKLVLHRGEASKAAPYRAFFRFPLAKQAAGTVAAGLSNPERCLTNCRAFWKSWSAFRPPVAWAIPGRQGEFVEACARNILQAREVHDGKLTFQVGPTCYRGLWVVDGNFILEAARYLGYDKDAAEGLRTTWSKQLDSGQIVAGGGKEHWKDTAIAMFTLVRQCELSQDWSMLRELEPQVAKAIAFLRTLQAEAVRQDSALGRYGLLCKGFADGGVSGPCDEFTNTVWVLAGLKAIAEAAERQKLAGLNDARDFYNQLQAAFLKAAPQEMRRYESRGFDYLPMVLKNDPLWQVADPWERPRPQSAQWALSHAIFPGCVFPPQHPVVRGHVDLMQAVVKEGIPSETGWNRHEAVWGYNSAFVAEVYLWLGMRQAAHDTFIGFLNHASPQFCWREEQPVQNALVGSYVGDMPHNWASAECIRYSRHMLALEDAAHLRLLAGITDAELEPQKDYALTATPTRFGRLSLRLEPLDRAQGWRLTFERQPGPAPERVSLPVNLGRRFHFAQTDGAHSRVEGDLVLVDSNASRWTALWKG